MPVVDLQLTIGHRLIVANEKYVWIINLFTRFCVSLTWEEWWAVEKMLKER